MENFDDVMNIVELLDGKMGADGISRINLHVDDTVAGGAVQEAYHHGRCDVGSPWATGTVGNVNFDGLDRDACG